MRERHITTDVVAFGITLEYNGVEDYWFFRDRATGRDSTTFDTREEALQAWPNWIVWFPEE